MTSNPLSRFIFAGATLLSASSLHAADGTWNSDSAGNWSDTTKWDGGTVANAADFTALFDDVITANRTITLDSSRTIGNVTAADTTHNYTIQNNTLTLSRTSGSPTISVPSGRTLTISSVIAGSGGFTKTGDGTATLSGGNTITGDVTVSGGLINWAQPADRTFTSLSGSGDFYRTSQNATLSILDASAFQGNLRTFAGGNSSHTIEFKSLGDASGAGNLQTGGGTGDSNQRTTFRLYGNVGPLTLNNRSIEILPKSTTPSNWSGRATQLENNNGTASNKWVIVKDLINVTDRNHELELKGSNAGDNEFAGDIGNSTAAAFYSTQTGELSVIKSGAGKWILSGANTYTGNTTIVDGTLEIRGAGQLGSGGVYPGNIISTDTTPSPFTFDSSANTTISGTISGGMSFIKDGAGTLSLTGPAIHTGGTTVAGGTLSLGDGTNSAGLNDFATFSVETGAVVNLNYTGSDNVLFLNLGGSPAAGGTWGATGSGATNINDTYFTGTGVINNLNGDTTAIGQAFWDGGTTDPGVDGNTASDGGTGTWDDSIPNWDYGTVPHAAWLNTTSTTAYFGGTTGTVTLGADMDIENLNIQVPNAGGSAYFIGDATEENTLTFGGNKTITVTATGSNTNQRHTIRAGIAGSPTLNISGPNSNSVDSFSLLPPAGVTMTLGQVNMLNTLGSNKRLILGGESAGNVADAVTWPVTSNQLMLTKAGTGSWTITNNVNIDDGRLYVEAGTLTLGGTNNIFSHKVGVATTRETTFTASNQVSKLVAKGTFTILDNREYFFVQNQGTLSPGPGVETLTVRWTGTSTGTHGQFNMQTGSTYEWGIASATSTDIINVQRNTSPSGSLTLGNMTIKVNDAGVSTPIAATDQLTVFTYQTGVTRSIGTVTIDTSGLGAGWSGTPSLVDNGTGTIYITGLVFTAGPATPYDQWVTDNGVTGGPGDDDDADGLDNRLEFGIGTDPKTGDNLSLLADGSRNGTPIVQATGSGSGVTFDFVFVRRDDFGTSGSVSYTVQFSNEMTTWYNSGATPTFVADSTDDADYEVVKVPYPGMLPNGKKARFARLSVDPVP